MTKGKIYSYKNGNVHAREYITIQAKDNNQSLRKSKNPNQGFIAAITKKIRKIRWPRFQQQFYIGPGVDWE
jgi:hypothetical protein